MFVSIRNLLVLTMLIVTGDAKPPLPSGTSHPEVRAPKTLPVEPILAGLLNGSRSVLLMSSLPNRFLVIVSAPGQKDLTGAVVFDQKLENFTGQAATLYPPVLFTDKWPKVNVFSGLFFTVTDSTPSSYLVIINFENKKINLLNLETKDFTYGLWKYDQFHFLMKSIPLSSSENMAFFALFNSGGNILGAEYTLNGSSSVTTSTNFQATPDTKGGPSLCNTPEGQVYLSGGCTPPLTWSEWNITTGFVDSSSAYLIDSSHMFIRKFDASAFNGTKQPATSIAFSSFWLKGVIPTTTTKAPLTSTTPHSSRKINIILGAIFGSMLLLFLLIFGIYAYCHLKPEEPYMVTLMVSPPKADPKQPTTTEAQGKSLALKSPLSKCGPGFTYPGMSQPNAGKATESRLPSYVQSTASRPNNYKLKPDSLMEALKKEIAERDRMNQYIAENPTKHDEAMKREFGPNYKYIPSEAPPSAPAPAKVKAGRGGGGSLGKVAKKRTSLGKSVISKQSLAKRAPSPVGKKRSSGKCSPKGKRATLKKRRNRTSY